MWRVYGSLEPQGGPAEPGCPVKKEDLDMKRICSLLVAGALVFPLVIPSAGAAEAAPATLEETAQTAAQAALTTGGAQSIQYAVWQDGEIILTGRAGDYSRTENRALTDDMLYGIGSVSKAYTAAAVLNLAEEGKIDLDAPVTAYLPDFTMADERYTDITVRMLLNHSSGLPGSTTANGFLLDDPDTLAADTLLEELSGETLKADPGAFSVYCNDGFTLAELVVEAVSGMDFDQIQLLAGPLFHGAPHIAAMNGLFTGGTLILPPSLCPDILVECVEKYKVQFIQTVPTLMHRIIKMAGLKKESFASLQALCHTGGVCSEWLKRAWLEILPPEKIYEMYSMTEVIGMCAIRGDEWLRHPGSVGLPQYGSKISIRDCDGKELGPYEVGNIYMSPPAGFFYTEYINERPLNTLDDNFRSVGDMGYVDSEGYLYFADRRSDMIVTGGENVFAAEVENAMLRDPHVLDAVVVGIPDAEWGRRLHAVLETDGQIDAAELKSFLKQFLLPYKIPKTYEFVKRIKRKENGKIARDEVLNDCIARGV